MFQKLRIYTVHQRAGRRLEDEAPVFVREGFSWGAFLFTPAWTLYHRLWLPSACVVAFVVVLAVLQQQGLVSDNGGLALMLGMELIAGFHGNDWRRAGLKKRGYVTAGITSGETLMRAERRFFDQQAA